MSKADQLPPYNLEAERSVIGAMLLDNDVILDVVQVLKPEDFFRGEYGTIYRTILALSERTRVDGLLLADELIRIGEFERAGGDEMIREAMESTPSAANAAHYADIVRQLSTCRGILEAAQRSIEEVYSRNHTADELIDLSERRIFAIGQRQGAAEPERADIGYRKSIERMIERREGRIPGGLGTGFYELDDMLGGFRAGQMIILAARPSMGKTAFALSIASHVSLEQGVGVLFVSMEMNRDEINDRHVCLRSGVDMPTLRHSRYASDSDLRQIIRSEGELPSDMRFWIDDSQEITTGQIRAKARRFKARHDIGLIIIDYLSLIIPDDDRKPRHEQVAAMSRKLKAMAKEIGIPVLVLAQLNRNTEARQDNKPKLADLRESGQIEQDADAVLMIHRPEYYEPGVSPGIAELMVVKNRSGATGTLKLSFEGPLMRFSNIEDRYEANF